MIAGGRRETIHCPATGTLSHGKPPPRAGHWSSKWPNFPDILSMLSSSQDSIKYAYQLIPGLLELQGKLSNSRVPEYPLRRCLPLVLRACCGSKSLNHKILDPTVPSCFTLVPKNGPAGACRKLGKSLQIGFPEPLRPGFFGFSDPA